ncbi:hypothetical protein AIOL_001970 [Candidatus Rhodobacter oscarellae]|uniref:Uncharacterized protein n=1 Tax=Candidatus Rhodobacter oscarellae TaxID=1675527 RepID=A0A0J9E2S5_9RHOB|nr:hypothetical protein AIOL_001970 [Candidatus Rhodobacter lobularis]
MGADMKTSISVALKRYVPTFHLLEVGFFTVMILTMSLAG